MVGKLASHIAGFKLIWIISVLLIPFLAICYMTTSSLREGLAETERAGEALVQQRRIMPLLLTYQRTGSGRDLVLEGLQGIVDETQSEDVRIALSELQTMPATSSFDSAIFGKKLAQKTATLSFQSGETSTFGTELVFLTDILTQRIPDHLVTIASLKAEAAKAQANGRFEMNDRLAIRRYLGDLNAGVQLTQRHVQSAERNAGDMKLYTDLTQAVLALTAPSAVIDGTFDDALRLDTSRLPAAITTLASQFSDLMSKTDKAWNLTADAVESLLVRRNARLIWRLKVILALALAASLTGIGSAIYLFRSSFRRLDELETAKVQAEAAQTKSDDMNRRLTTINNEIVHLNQELADKMRRLKDAQDELLKRGRMEQLGQLTATVAHELRNPLGAVRTSAFLLERKVKGKGLGVEAQLQRINNGISRCDSIITQLLDFSRTKQISAQAANLDDWLVGVVEEEAKRLPAVIEIDCALGLGGAEVPFDPGRLQRAIINLLSNAAEAMVGAGDDPTKFAVKQPMLSISTAKSDKMAIITVKDNGPGIAADILDKIREPLFTTKSFGTGLGIPAVEQIATQHGGHLQIASESGDGARFSIFLPLVMPDTQAA